nr:major facilitator superfamily domain-containing protein 7-a [Quercus suber]
MSFRYTPVQTSDTADTPEHVSGSTPMDTKHMSDNKDGLLTRITSRDSGEPSASTQVHTAEENEITSSLPEYDSTRYHLYRRRWFGLAQLVLLNIIVSWDWLTFAAVSTTSAEYFEVTESSINWLSTGFLFAFVPVSPLVIWTLNKGGPKISILVASGLVLIGNWVRYAGTVSGRHGHFGVVVLGQVIIGFAQPFVLAAPTRYSNIWFSDAGRVSATAVASLANPFGGALGQLIGPFWATSASGIPTMVLYTSIISTIICLPAPFISKSPPTPPSAVAAAPEVKLMEAFRILPKNISFFLIVIPFSVYVGFFNATSSLLNQILEPYEFSETDAGIAGAILIVVGLVSSAVVSPFVDRTKNYVLVIKILVPAIALSYLILIFMPATRSLPGPYIICALLGATSFSLLPCALEYLVVVTNPVSPEITSTICWTGGQLLGAIFILIMTALQDGLQDGAPPGNMLRALIFQAVIAIMVVPFPMWLGTRTLRTREVA